MHNGGHAKKHPTAIAMIFLSVGVRTNRNEMVGADTNH